MDDSETSGTSDSTGSDSEGALLEEREKEEAELVDDDGDALGPAGGHGHDDDDDTSSESSDVDLGDLPPVSFDQVGLQNFEVTPSANLRAKCFTCGNGFSPGGAPVCRQDEAWRLHDEQPPCPHVLWMLVALARAAAEHRLGGAQDRRVALRGLV